MDFNVMDFIVENFIVLIPALNILGMFVKEAELVRDEHIPLLLTALGVIGTTTIGGFTPENVVQGVLVAGGAVLGHQIVKQDKKKDMEDDDRLE